jgi:hypothetical protein
MREQTGKDAIMKLESNIKVLDAKLIGKKILTIEEEFVDPEFEEDAYYSTLSVTPSFDDLETNNCGEILMHWHYDWRNRRIRRNWFQPGKESLSKYRKRTAITEDHTARKVKKIT